MTSVPTGPESYGLAPPVATAVAAPGTVSSPTDSTVATHANTAGTAFHQNPFVLLLGLIFLAFVLSRLAEHGLGLGVVVKGRV
jgi:hypothetical protein